jgi:hypothetical protein
VRGRIRVVHVRLRRFGTGRVSSLAHPSYKNGTTAANWLCRTYVELAAGHAHDVEITDDNEALRAEAPSDAIGPHGAAVANRPATDVAG